MRFLYPEVLFALIALAIPVLVHLFRLRPVKKEWFTNVALLQKLQVQTRRISKLKKRLLLASRLLMLTAVILAFARPVAADKFAEKLSSDTLIYIDNSLSMQAEGAKGPLLEEAVQLLLNKFPSDERVQVFTNNTELPTAPIESLHNELLSMGYSPVSPGEKELRLKVEGLLSDKPQRLLILSDFKDFSEDLLDSLPNLEVYSAVFEPLNNVNASVDTLWIEKKSERWQLEVRFSTNGSVTNVPVSVWNGSELLAKSTFSTDQAETVSETFELSAQELAYGRVEIEDNSYGFDNELYFSVQPQEKIKVLVIGDTLSNYLKRIYTPDEFDLQHTSPQSIDFSQLDTYDFLVINEVQRLPVGMAEALVRKTEQGGGLMVILPDQPDVGSYKNLVSAFGDARMENLVRGQFLITTVNVAHPVFNQVFEKSITNFDYPRVTSYVKISGGDFTPLLQLANNDIFFGTLRENVFLITASLQSTNGNFQKSPLIVPAFYSTARNSLNLPELYISIGQQTKVAVKTELNKEEVLNLSLDEGSYIPLQITQPQSVLLTFEDTPALPGHYPVLRGNDTLKILSFNYLRKENSTPLIAPSSANDQSDWAGKPEVILNNWQDATSADEFWKWFVIFALVFLLAETLIIKLLP